MAAFRRLLALLLLLVCVSKSSGSIWDIRYPNINISSETTGDVVVQGGTGGDILLEPGKGGTVYINQYDIEDIIERVKSLPPVWTKMTVHDSLGTFDAGKSFNVTIVAQDPEGGALMYQLISGRLPPGISLNTSTGVISGVAPNYDATYSFSIRVTDVHGKYADGSFSIDIRERELCSSAPCNNGGQCQDVPGGFKCVCPPLYGGKICDMLCAQNPLGVGIKTKTIPDAQITAHYSFKDYKASNGRLDAVVGTGWVGEGLGSWLQVDLDSEKKINGLATEGVDTNYITAQFTLQYSTDGNVFTNYTDSTGKTKKFSGTATYVSPLKLDVNPPFRARFVRFLPTRWHAGASSHPGLKVELFGC